MVGNAAPRNRPPAPFDSFLCHSTLLIWHQWGNQLNTGNKLDTGFQSVNLVAKYINGFIQKNVFGIFPFFFGRQFFGEIAFVSLQTIIPKRAALSSREFLALSILVGGLARIPP